MLAHPTQERLLTLGLAGMARALDDQRRQPDIAALSFEERLALLLDRETIERENKRLVTRLRFAALRQEAVVEDLDVRAARGLDRRLFQKLAGGEWIDRKQNVLIVGPTGVGKSWLACALGHKACRDNRSVVYHRVPRLLEALALARGDGRHGRLLKAISRVQLVGAVPRPWTTGAWRRSPVSSAAICWRSWTIGMTGVRPSSPANGRSTTGTR